MTKRLVEIIFLYFYEDPLPIMEELNRLGIFFSSTYSSKAYYHQDYHVPIYAYGLLHYIRQNPYNYSLSGPYHLDTNLLEEILSEEANREVFRTLKGFNYDCRESEFEKIIEKYDGIFGEGSFKKAMVQLLEKGVVVTPGNGFGEPGEGYIRIALTQKRNRLAEAIDRINTMKF